MNRGQRDIARQLAAMEAAGLGERDPVAAAQQRRAGTTPARGPQWREWWRVAVGAVLLVGGVGLWLAAHTITAPAMTYGRYGLASNLDAVVRATNERLLLEVVGVVTAFVGVVWLLNQVWPRRRTYSPREVWRAWIIAALLVAGAVLCVLANRHVGLGPATITGLGVVLLQTGFITRMTGPDTTRHPTNDPRGDVIRALTPWPVMLGISLVFCAFQVLLLVR